MSLLIPLLLRRISRNSLMQSIPPGSDVHLAAKVELQYTELSSKEKQSIDYYYESAHISAGFLAPRPVRGRIFGLVLVLVVIGLVILVFVYRRRSKKLQHALQLELGDTLKQAQKDIVQIDYVQQSDAIEDN